MLLLLGAVLVSLYGVVRYKSTVVLPQLNAELVTAMYQQVNSDLSVVADKDIVRNANSAIINPESGKMACTDGGWIKYSIHTAHYGEDHHMKLLFGLLVCSIGSFDKVVILDNDGNYYESTEHFCDGLILSKYQFTKAEFIHDVKAVKVDAEYVKEQFANH
ncbi:MAG: hypothetical protein AAB263_14855 [Planctomycetota bacterium]